MSDKPLFSIVTICYNSAKTIERTILSILKQDEKDYEYLVVDGKSTDATIDILNNYKSKFEGRMRFTSEPDKGIYDAMNKGIRNAIGKYIWIVNSDDYISDNVLSLIKTQILESGNNEQSIIVGGLNLIDGHTSIYATPPNRTHMVKCYCNLSMGINHPSTIVPRKIYQEVGLYDDRYYISADIDFFLRCMNKKIDFQFINSALTNMTMDGISNQLPIKKNIHDWNLRYSKYCHNKLSYMYYMTRSVFKMLVRKVLPASFINKMFYRNNESPA